MKKGLRHPPYFESTFLHGMKALPDEEGIETTLKECISQKEPGMKALPDEEGIETCVVLPVVPPEVQYEGTP